MTVERFREILSHWAATVGIAAVRDDDRVYGTTVTSFTPVDIDPPRVLISLGPNAQVLPFLKEGSRYVVNFLEESQERLASTYADPFPVGPSPFPASGDPVVAGALGWLGCDVARIVELESGTRLVVGDVVDGDVDPARRPQLWYRRGPTRLATER